MQQKIRISILFIICILQLFSCDKKRYGDAIFWQKTGSGFGITNVTINDLNAAITVEYNAYPGCRAEGCAVFTNLEEGVYNYTAYDGSYSWSGYITISEGCLSLELN